MSNKELGGHAFPFPSHNYPDGSVHPGEGGMTLRDYFAAQAMAAIISKFPAYKDDVKPNLFNAIAVGAYGYADAMLEARK